MLKIPVISSDETISVQQFWNATLLYLNNPHFVNRRLTGCVKVLLVRVEFRNDNFRRLKEVFTKASLLYEVRKLKDIAKDYVTEKLISNILETYDKNVKICKVSLDEFERAEDGTYVALQILLPRNKPYERCVQLVVLDKAEGCVSFCCICEFNKKAPAPTVFYDIEVIKDGYLQICVDSFEDAEDSSVDWLCDHLFEKLMRWAVEKKDAPIQPSLSLVSIEVYNGHYLRLKEKYGKSLVEAWTERTDPYKFVYEDIAIAAYLISLWDQTDPQRRPKFVDLGCGNGLLVHILNQENYPGYGIDIRKRKIWDTYPKSTCLKEATINPSTQIPVYPDCDWIIGNHSDELTPWIPVIASRSSPTTNFFLLPCCPYEFNGSKYKRHNSSLSTYTDYFNYLKNICATCRFNIKFDRLRIPSTKRTCIVSFGRFLKDGQIDEEITSLVHKKGNFRIRPAVEKVRNCTQLDRKLVSDIVGRIFQILLNDRLKRQLDKKDGGVWNRGGIVALPDLVKAVDRENLQQLKNECGGLQTLIRNHRFIFDVKKGTVELRVPQTLEEVGGKYKEKECWFYKNHPDGCLYNGNICCYQHT